MRQPWDHTWGVSSVEGARVATIPALETQNLTLRYNGQPVLSDFSLAVPEGARVAVVGPNGAGKSTLFKGVVGLVPGITGTVLIHGQPRGRMLSRVAYVPQREEIDWSFPVTSLDVVLMGRYGHVGWLRRPKAADYAVARRLLAELGLGELERWPIGDLSGGQQQRLFLARALAQEPSLLLMDEPFAAVDEPTRAALLAMFAQLAAQRTTIIVSTHDLELAVEQFDHLLLVNRRLIAFGPAQQILTTEALIETFGASSFSLSEGRYLALTNKCCPPIRPALQDKDGRAHG
jgi:ABC-type Mn2+/Zn2+ transport system ATPase subunit